MLNLDLKPYEYRLFLCKPNKTTIAELSEAFNRRIIFNLIGLHELSFNLPFQIEKNNELIRNPHIDMLRGDYLIRLDRKNESDLFLDKEYFIIKKPKNITEDGREVKQVQCFLLPYELTNKYIRNYSGTKTLVEVMSETLEYKSTWTVGTIASEISNTYRTFDEVKVNLLDFVNKVAETFDVVAQWDTVNKQVSFYKFNNIGEDKRLSIEYGKYLKSLEEEPDFDNVVTRLYCYGKDGLSINSLNSTGSEYLEDLSYYKNSNYMSDGLIQAQNNYETLLQSKEPEVKTAESGTTATNITITNHGLATGDYIKNITRDEYREVTVVDVNNLTVESISGQTVGDTINLYAEGTFGKLLFKKQDLQEEKTIKENELQTLENELAIIQDNKDIAFAQHNEYDSNYSYTVDDTVIYNDIPYICIQGSLGNPPTDTNYWANILTQESDKQSEINAKQSEIDQIDADIANVESDIETLQNEVAIENNFTAEQIEERSYFIKEMVWQNNNYVDENDLFNDGKEKLARISQPIVSYRINIVDFLNVVECQHDWDKLVLGDIITIKYPNFNIDIKAKIMSIEINIDENVINLTIANDKDLKNGILDWKDFINKTISTSTQVDMRKFRWNEVENVQTDVDNILNQVWQTAERAINAGVNESVEINRRGITIKDPTDPQRFVRMTHGTIGLTKDGGNTFKLVANADGIFAERLVGKIILGNQLTISDTDGILEIIGNLLTVKDNLGNTRIQLGGIDTDGDDVDDLYGLRAEHENGGYTQLNYEGLKRYVPIPQYQENPTGVPNIEDFESGVIPSEWEYHDASISTTSYSGNYSLNIADNSDAAFARVIKYITKDNTTFSFKYKCANNTASNYIVIDGQRTSLTADGVWNTFSTTINKGYHVFQWEGEPDAFVDMYIDDIIFEQNPVDYEIIGYTNQGYEYNYRNYIGTASTFGSYFNWDHEKINFVPNVWIQLPDEFKGKDFKVFLSLKDFGTNTTQGCGLIDLKLNILEIDYANARFKVEAYAHGYDTEYKLWGYGTSYSLIKYRYEAWTGLDFNYFVTY